MTIKLKTLRPLRYDRQSYLPGDVFDAEELHAKILVSIGKAGIQTAAMEADEPKRRPRRRYKRRDITAENYEHRDATE